MTENLKPCPFCGGKMLLNHGLVDAFLCNECGAVISFRGTKNLKESFNRRTDDWNSIENGLPEVGQEVAIISHSGNVARGYFRDRDTWACEGHYISPEAITHWIPLPPEKNEMFYFEPPERSKDE